MSNMDVQFELVRWFVLLAAGVVAAVTDLRTRRIPNWLTFPMVLSGLFVMLLVDGLGWRQGLGDSFLGLVTVSLPFLLVYCLGGGGAGDVKFMMGVGAWSGVDLGMYILGSVLVLGAGSAIVWALVRGQFRALWYGVVAETARILLHRRGTGPTLPATATGTKAGLDGAPASATVEEQVDKPVGAMAFAPLMLGGIVLGGAVFHA